MHPILANDLAVLLGCFDEIFAILTKNKGEINY